MPYQVFSFCIKLPSLQLLLRLMLCASKSQSTFSTYINKRDATTTSDTLQVEHITHRVAFALAHMTWTVSASSQVLSTSRLSHTNSTVPRAPLQEEGSWTGRVGAVPSGDSEGTTDGRREWRSPSKGNHIKPDDRTRSKCLV